MGRVQKSKWVLLVLLVLVACVTQSCGDGPASQVAATGTIRCSHVTGSVDFSPSLAVSGRSPERISVRAHLSHCSSSESNISSVSGGLTTMVIAVPTNACSGLLQFPSSLGNVSTPSSSRAITATTRWNTGGIRPTLMTFSGFVLTTNDAGAPGFAFPGVGHRAKVSGSFAGDDGGALSVASVFTAEKVNEIVSRCSTSSGLASIDIASGQMTFA